MANEKSGNSVRDNILAIEQNIAKVMVGCEDVTRLIMTALITGGHVLLEDLGNLMANEIFSPEGRGPRAVRDGIDALIPACAHLTIVTNEIFSGGTDYTGETLHYMRELAAMNRYIASRADRVTEIVCGIPNRLK